MEEVRMVAYGKKEGVLDASPMMVNCCSISLPFLGDEVPCRAADASFLIGNFILRESGKDG